MNNNKRIDIKKIDSIHELSEVDCNGNEMNLDFYKGKVCLVVNMTTKCENSLNCLKMLSELNRKYQDKGNYGRTKCVLIDRIEFGKFLPFNFLYDK